VIVSDDGAITAAERVGRRIGIVGGDALAALDEARRLHLGL
jgi:hypothetical protein